MLVRWIEGATNCVTREEIYSTGYLPYDGSQQGKVSQDDLPRSFSSNWYSIHRIRETGISIKLRGAVNRFPVNWRTRLTIASFYFINLYHLCYVHTINLIRLIYPSKLLFPRKISGALKCQVRIVIRRFCRVYYRKMQRMRKRKRSLTASQC